MPAGIRWAVLDTSVLLGGHEMPQGVSCATTPEAVAEVSPGGRDARRFDGWFARGLQVRQAGRQSADAVEDTASVAGNLVRLSPADRSLLALAHELKATLWTDDHTMLDVARRLGVAVQTLGTKGIVATLDFKPRCTGCGRWYDAAPKGDECTVCGSPVKAKPWKPA